MSCGAETPESSEFCQNCGYSITGRVKPTQTQMPAKDGFSVSTIVIIVIVAVVIVPVVLSALLYFMVLGFGEAESQTPVSMLSKMTITSGMKFTFGPVSTDTHWSDVTILLSDGFATQSWAPASSYLDTGLMAVYAFPSKSLGSLTIYLNIILIYIR